MNRLNRLFLNYKQKALVFGVFALALGLLMPEPVYAQNCTSFGANSLTDNALVCGVMWLISTLLYWIIFILGWLLATLVGWLITLGLYNDFIVASPVVLGWNIVRDIANMFFVLVLLVISFGTILRIEQYSLKKLLPKVLLMAVLVNFSKAIAGLIIDAGQVVMLTFVTAYQQAGAGNFLQAMGLEKILTISGSEPVVLQEPDAITTANLLPAFFLGFIYTLVSFVVVLVFLIFLLMRIAALWLLIIFSPLAYVLSVVPAGQKYASQWWEHFTKYVITGPVIAFFLWLSLATLPTITNNLSSVLAASEGKIPPASITEAGGLDSLFSFGLSTAMLVMSLAFTAQIGGAAGKVAGGAVNFIQKAGAAPALGALRLGAGLGKAAGTGLRQYVDASGHLTKWTGVPLSRQAWSEAAEQAYKRRHERRTKQSEDRLKDIYEHGLIPSIKKSFRGGGIFKRGIEKARGNHEKASQELAVLKGRRENAAGMADARRRRLQDQYRTNEQRLESSGAVMQEIDRRQKEIEKKREKEAETMRQQGATEEAILAQTEAYTVEINGYDRDRANEQAIRDRLNEEQQEIGKEIFEVESTNAQGVATFRRDADGKLVVRRGNERELSEREKEELQGRKRKASIQADAVSSGYLNDEQVIRQLQAIKKELDEANRLVQEHREHGATDDQIRPYQERVNSLEAAQQGMRNYLQMFQDKGDHTFGDDGFSEDELQRVVGAENLSRVRNENMKKDMKLSETERDQLVSELRRTAATSEGRIVQPLSSEKLAELDQSITAKEQELKQYAEQAASLSIGRGFYQESGRRELVADELKRVQTANYEELIQYFKEAQKAGDKYRMQAVLNKLANDYNENEITNDMGYSSNFGGYRRFFENEVIGGKAAIGEQEALSVANDVSNVAESKGHWGVARTISVDPVTGKYRWKTEREQVTEVMAEMDKQSPAEILRRLNRLAYGGESANDDGRVMQLGPLALGLMRRLESDFGRFIGRRELNKDTATKLLRGLNALPNVPDELKSLQKQLSGYVTTEELDERFDEAKDYQRQSGLSSDEI